MKSHLKLVSKLPSFVKYNAQALEWRPFTKIYSTGIARVPTVVSRAFYYRLDVCNLCKLLFQTQFLSNYPTIIIFYLYNNTPQVNNKCIISCNHLLTCYAKVITSLRWNKTRTTLQSYLRHGHLLLTVNANIK
jgi:hypothetical protein